MRIDGSSATTGQQADAGASTFDDLIPPWLFAVRSPLWQAVVALAIPMTVVVPLALVSNPNVRFGPLLALACMAVAAITSWRATVLAGLLTVAAYWLYGVPVTKSFRLEDAGGATAVVGMAVFATGLVALTRRVERTVDEVRELDRERRAQIMTSDTLRVQVQRSAEFFAGALDAGRAMATAIDRRSVAEAFLDSVQLPERPSAGSVALVQGNRLRLLASLAASAEVARSLEEVDVTASGWLRQVIDGHPVFVEDRADFAKQHPGAAVLDLFPSGSWVVLPFRTDDSLGLLSLHYRTPQPLREFESYFVLVTDLLAASLARATAEEARAGELRQLEQAFEERDRIARILSTSLVPPVLPQLPGVQAAGWLEPASSDQVAGDFYDLFPIGRGDWVAVLGDVSGKGAEAAAVTSLARYAARAAALSTPDPLAVLDLANRALAADPSEHYCTMAVVHFSSLTNEIEVSLAGHHPARLIRDGAVRRIGTFGSPLGLGLSNFSLARATLEPGDVLVLFSDGVTDRNPKTFGEDELDGLLAALDHDPDTLIKGLQDHIEGLTPLHYDDIAVLAVQLSSDGPGT